MDASTAVACASATGVGAAEGLGLGASVCSNNIKDGTVVQRNDGIVGAQCKTGHCKERGGLIPREVLQFSPLLADVTVDGANHVLVI